MADGTVRVSPDSTGKIIDTSELTRPDATVVERQRMVIADPDRPEALLSLSMLKQGALLGEIRDLLREIRDFQLLNGGRL